MPPPSTGQKIKSYVKTYQHHFAHGYTLLVGVFSGHLIRSCRIRVCVVRCCVRVFSIRPFRTKSAQPCAISALNWTYCNHVSALSMKYVKHRDGSFSIHLLDTTQRPCMVRRFYNYTKFQALRHIVSEKINGGWTHNAVCFMCNDITPNQKL